MSRENAATMSEFSSLSAPELDIDLELELEFELTDTALSDTENIQDEAEVDSKIIENVSRTHLAKVIGSVTVATTLAIGLPYPYDVGMNRLKETHAPPTVKTVVKPPQDSPDSGSITYNVNGIDTSNSKTMTIRLAPAFQQVSPDKMKSIDLRNADLDPITLAHQIMADAQREGKDKVTLVGNSTGGIIVLQVAEEIIKKSDLKVETIYLYETPDGVDGLKAGSKKDLAMLLDWVGNFPASEDSSYMRDIATVLMESPRYMNSENPFEFIGKFMDTFWDATETTRSQERPRIKTLLKQGWIVANADLEATINNIGKMKDQKYMPTVVTIMSDPKKATVVDTVKSTKAIKDYFYKAGINTFSIVVDSDTQRHTSYDFDTEANVEAIAPWVDKILASHSENTMKVALRNSEYFQQDTIENNG